MVEGVIERSIYGFPGYISAIVDGKLLEKKGKSLISELVPSPSALMIRLNGDIDHISEAIIWAKSKNMKVGIESFGKIDVLPIIKNKYSVDFVRLRAGKDNNSIKKEISLLRTHGIKHEVVYGEPVNKLKDVNHIETLYKECSPCDNFIVEFNKNENCAMLETLLAIKRKYPNFIVRILKG